VVATEMSYVLSKNKQELYRQFQWDSVFSPSCNLIDYKTDSTGLICTIKKSCKRIKFLQDTSIIFKTNFVLKGNKIAKISLIDYVYFDTLSWQTRRDSLVAWIDKNYPKLSGFVYDMTPNGAQNYLKAIDLFKTENQMTNNKDSENLLIVKEFVSAINSANVERMIDLMHPNHKFIDSQNNTITGKENNKKAWIAYFDWFTDYKIEIETVFENDTSIALFGFAEGTYKIKKNEQINNHWKLPAAWFAEIEDEKIKQWQVYFDSKPVFDIIEKNK
jgi:ketosteroid isomerase-like protein